MARAKIYWISGPLLRARSEGAFAVNEAVFVGERDLLGEVIRLNENEIVAQVYEDTTGLRPGVEVRGSGLPLAVEVGPGLVGKIFDGLLRPLAGTGHMHIRPGLKPRGAERFVFTASVRKGEILDAGTAFGKVMLGDNITQLCLLPPDCGGRVAEIATDGEYREDEPVCTLESTTGSRERIAMRHTWPVRQPRPVAEHLPIQRPMFTGQRILDALFPLPQGSRAALPGGFGTGKTVLLEALAKWCDADVIVYVGCGERGNEMAGVLREFPELIDPRSGRPLMERTVIIANTSNMPVAAREASIYTGVTVAEYFRDQGLHVALLADSTSRWAEALREISGRLGELPGESGYPSYLGSRLAEFYERAGRVRTLSRKEGSVSLISTISPAAGDFSEPVTSHSKRYVRSFWALDRVRAQARFYPAIDPLQSYSENVEALAWWWKDHGNAGWANQRRQFLEILAEQTRLERMARIIGKDALPPRQQGILLCGELIDQGFLRQSAFSPVDRYASPVRQGIMMSLINRFIDQALRVIDAGISPEELARLPVLRRLLRMGEEFPESDLDGLRGLEQQLDTEFAELETHATDAG